MTKVGKILRGAVKLLVPGVGDLVENLDSEDGGKGMLDVKKLVYQVTRLVIFAIAVYLFLKGEIGFEDLKDHVPTP
jgi:hypothetical protein